MKTLCVDLTIPRVVTARALGRLTPVAYWSGLGPLRYLEMDAPPLPGPRWVRVRNRFCGICGTDLHWAFAEGDLRIAPAAIQGSRPRFYLGHEVVGTVTETGAAVQRVRVGQRVALQQSFSNCLLRELDPPCARCAAGEPNLCEGPREGGAMPIGGGWGDEMVVHESQLFAVPDGIPDATAALLEPAAVGIRAVLRRQPPAGGRALVVGCGTVGLMTLKALRFLAPNVEVTCIARYLFQAELAHAFGAHRVIVGAASYEALADITGGRVARGVMGNETLLGGFDVVYDAVGRAATLQDALRWARAGGAVVLVGIDFRPLRVDLTPTWYHEVDLIGVAWHGRETWQGETLTTFDVAARGLLSGQLSLDRVVTHVFPLADYAVALQTAANKASQAVKVLFDLQA